MPQVPHSNCLPRLPPPRHSQDLPLGREEHLPSHTCGCNEGDLDSRSGDNGPRAKPGKATRGLALKVSWPGSRSPGLDGLEPLGLLVSTRTVFSVRDSCDCWGLRQSEAMVWEQEGSIFTTAMPSSSPAVLSWGWLAWQLSARDRIKLLKSRESAAVCPWLLLTWLWLACSAGSSLPGSTEQQWLTSSGSMTGKRWALGDKGLGVLLFLDLWHIGVRVMPMFFFDPLVVLKLFNVTLSCIVLSVFRPSGRSMEDMCCGLAGEESSMAVAAWKSSWNSELASGTWVKPLVARSWSRKLRAGALSERTSMQPITSRWCWYWMLTSQRAMMLRLMTSCSPAQAMEPEPIWNKYHTAMTSLMMESRFNSLTPGRAERNFS